jgi:hypothetical protein
MLDFNQNTVGDESMWWWVGVIAAWLQVSFYYDVDVIEQ